MTKSFSVVRNSTPASAIARGAVVALGNFDGVHLGHRMVISAAMDLARKHGRPAFAVTFEPHPRSFFSPNTPQFRLTDEAAKLRLLAGTGLDGAVIMTFDGARAGTTAQDFINHDLIARLGDFGGIAVGYDFISAKAAAVRPRCWPPKRRGWASRSTSRPTLIFWIVRCPRPPSGKRSRKVM